MGSYQPKALGNSLLKEFPIDRTFRNLNHGSFGTYPIAILNKFRELQDKFEASPDRFLRFELAFYLLESRKALSSLLNTPVNSTVFVKNATTGVNTVLRNLVYHPGDIIVYFSTVYGAVEKLIASLAETTPVRARKVNYEFPISHDELVQRFMDTVTKARSEGLNVRIAVFDTIVSSPGIRLPFDVGQFPLTWVSWILTFSSAIAINGFSFPVDVQCFMSRNATSISSVQLYQPPTGLCQCHA
ncbi:uncharacterized protein TERG_08787 [Trichophyton rubrum CBS 118892]|uniref:Aminotransferase class V domain-containing protein n=1 Tax=Trichophyton rubrum (strain ATCC MYA-4607 / CBS 118892) TaxID=559305 RepID=F2SKT7_TRIRC|nr:uncharacterized protein TERG_08787 [Trichophyton rubrum CBS 118892]EGD87322.2 hypothetical protein TERG_08787 [Trichophyton rubrum CBS 118892]